jgi:predicted kinase
MVCEALIASDAWRTLTPAARDELFLAALLHDCGKPARTRTDEHGHIISPGHAAEGARIARLLLWEAGAELESRERIVGLIKDHGRPLFALTRPDPIRSIIESSCRVSCDQLAMLARADAIGRVCNDQADLLDRIDLYQTLLAEVGISTGPFPFANDRSRAEYFRTPGRDPSYAAFDDTWGEVVIMSGLPASGKSTFIQQRLPGLPVVGLDAIREALEVEPGESQDQVVRAAKEAAKELLRSKRSFVWDATNLSGDVRSAAVGLCVAYGARIRIEYIEAPAAVLRARNAKRERPVPVDAINRMLRRWECPDATEAEVVRWTVTHARD